jgi:hypothetical protein
MFYKIYPNSVTCFIKIYPKFCDMFRRNVITELGVWLTKRDYKPLVLRGARQVGKTNNH